MYPIRVGITPDVWSAGKYTKITDLVKLDVWGDLTLLEK